MASPNERLLSLRYRPLGFHSLSTVVPSVVPPAIPASTSASAIALMESQAALRAQMSAPLMYDDAGVFPPSRLLPLGIQQLARETAEAELALRLRTPIFPSSSATVAVATSSDNSHADDSQTTSCADKLTWNGPIGRHYRRESALLIHEDGGRDKPLLIHEDGARDNPVPLDFTEDVHLDDDDKPPRLINGGRDLLF